MNEDRYSIVSADISGVPPSNAWTRAKTGTFQQLAPGWVTGLAENVCVNDTAPRGLLHPRTYLTMFYRAEALAALAAGGYIPSAAPPDDWEQLIALLEAHRLANSTSSSGSSSSSTSSSGLPKYGLCITTHPDCGRLGDFWAALAASVLQTQGTQQGYLYDLAVPPPAAAPLANSTGWVHATELLRRMLAYNAPEPGVRERRECTDVSSHFLSGDCMVTFDWDVSVVKLRVAALRPPAAQLRVAPLPGSRTVADRRAGSATAGQLVPCDWELCGVSANHDLLYLPGPGHPGGGGNGSLDASAAAAAAAAADAVANAGSAAAQVRCNPAEAVALEAAAAVAVRAGLGGLAAGAGGVGWALVNRAPYSVMIQHFVRYQASTVGDTTSPARRFEALGEAVDSLVARVAILRGTVMAGARRSAGFPPANESTGVTGNPHSYLHTRWWELLRRPFDVRPYLALGLSDDTMQSHMAVLVHGLHSPNAASDVTSPILVNFVKWALSQAAYGLEPPAGEQAVANATAEVLRILDMMELAFGEDLLRSTYEDAVDAPAWTPQAPARGASDGGQGGDVIGHGALAGLLVGLIIAVALSVLALVFIMLRMRRRHRDLLGRVRAPRASPDTTLLISDIQNSTRLWEELSVATMDAALKTHHATFRKLMPLHDGYESATEGDSFIIAFPSPASALAFATACQLALLQQDWPVELLQHPDGAVVAVEARGGDALQLLAGATTSATAAAIAAAMALARTSETPKPSESGLLAADSTGVVAPLTGQLTGGRSHGPRRMLKSLDLPRNVEREALQLPASMLSMSLAAHARPKLSLDVPAAAAAQAAPAPAAPALDPTAAAATAEWVPVAAARSTAGRWSLSNTPISTGANTDYASNNTVFGCNTGPADEAAATSANGGDAAIDAAVAAAPGGRAAAVLRAVDLSPSPAEGESEPGLPRGLNNTNTNTNTNTNMERVAFAGPAVSVSQVGIAAWDIPATLVDDVPGPSSQPGGQGYAGGGLLGAGSRPASRPHSLKGTGFAGGGLLRTGGCDFPYPLEPASFGAETAGDDGPSLQQQRQQQLRRMLVPPSRPASAAHQQLLSAPPRPQSPWLGGGGGRTAPGATGTTARDQSGRPEAESEHSTWATWGQALAAAFPAATVPLQPPTTSRRGKRRLSNAAQLAKGFLSGGTGHLGSNVVAYRGLRVRMGIHTGLRSDACILTFNRVNSTYHYSGALAETAKLVSDAAAGGLVVLSAQAFTRLRNNSDTAAAAKADAVVIYAGHYVLTEDAQGAAAAANGQQGAADANGGGAETEGQDTIQTLVTGASAPGEVPLFLAVPAALLCRLAHTPPLRTVRQVQLGSLAAPTGSVTIAFMKVVGASTLLMDLPGPAGRALDQFQRLACGLLLPRSDAPGPATEAAGAAAAGPAAGNDAALECSGDGSGGGGGGYLVEGGDGLVLAAFGSPLAAVEWALDTFERLKGLAWEEELLAHEMCEEVLTAGPAPVSASPVPAKSRAFSSGGISITAALPPLPGPLMMRDPGCPSGQQSQAQTSIGPSRLVALAAKTGQPQRDLLQQRQQQQQAPPSLVSMRAKWRSLERGLRVKVGLDVGPVTYSLTESSGRLSYRGRVMNRAARIAGTASPGQLLCSGAVWAACEASMAGSTCGGGRQGDGCGRNVSLVGARLGALALKGIQAPVEVVQCFRAGEGVISS
ncbi:hypothetical protein HXX76_000774 [Chlamydomonas incerta]|uniref:Guanylate cyclase domain-containing protein n=1 Tax=Chlamydomonas incerta TaxID=51695 RepID=A0A836B2Y9_CHLIN|nr:hypothetical protein HXX76_000774 [Chlamydomonas incerta]|eukprot:KAG2446181.1 hypothetical protein HXX76_000774 [Chlamydomonas incerta]